jgi:hypothetical protein
MVTITLSSRLIEKNLNFYHHAIVQSSSLFDLQLWIF